MASLTEDYTPDISDAFDDAREEIAPGARLFLLRATSETEQGLEPIEIGDDPNGEVVAGWLSSQPRSRGRMILQICELGDVTRVALEQAWGFAILLPGDEVATVYENARDPEPPQVPTVRQWTFDAAYTRQPWTPEVSAASLLLESGGFLLLESGGHLLLESA